MRSDKTPVIIDTDPGVDDALAILFALASPELNILAIIVSYGNTDLEPSYLNVFKIYRAISEHIKHYPEDQARFPNFTKSTKTILARGASGPLDGAQHSAQYFHGRDGLAGLTERHPELHAEISVEHPQLEVTDKSGTDVALELIRSRPARTITYIPVGPMTNLAQLVRAGGDEFRERIGRIVCMGGAVDVPGNTSAVAEFNFFADPFAVRELLTPVLPTQGIPLDRFLLLPLDITTMHQLPFPLYKKHVDSTFESTVVPSNPTEKTPLTHFTSSFFERVREIMIEFGNDAMELHDIAAVWCAIENPPDPEGDGILAPSVRDGWAVARRRFEVECIGELTRGMLVVDRRDDEGAYDPGVNRATVQAELKVHGCASGVLESAALPAQVELERAPTSTQMHAHPRSVPCVVRTPGPVALQKMLLERVWGVRLSE